jgi:hypothetical protein
LLISERRFRITKSLQLDCRLQCAEQSSFVLHPTFKKQHKPSGEAVAAQEIHMQNKTHNKKASSLGRPAPQPKTRKPSPDWKPQPIGLTRSELRQIVGEILG